MMDILNGCDICGENHSTELCPELGLNNQSVQVQQLSTKARLTLPSFIEVVDDGHGLVGVVAKATIPKKTQFGPYEAKRTTHIFDDTGFFTLKVIGKDGTTVCLDTTDENECNWLCLVRAASSESDKNCMAYQLGGNIFYSTTRDIMATEELHVWYAPHFAKKLGKSPVPDGSSRVLLGHRIEPLTSDMFTGETQMFYSQEIEETENNQSTGAGLKDSNVATTEFPRGEIKKAFYCPRCGNTFSSQTEMVQHLREHILAENCKPKRCRGRPRKNGQNNESRSKYSGYYDNRSNKHGTRKSDPESTIAEDEIEFKATAKIYGRKRKAVSNELDGFIEKGTDDSTNPERSGGIDRGYTPHKEMSIKNRRVQPRRSTRGLHSKYDEDYVLYNIKKEKDSDDDDNELIIDTEDNFDNNRTVNVLNGTISVMESTGEVFENQPMITDATDENIVASEEKATIVEMEKNDTNDDDDNDDGDNDDNGEKKDEMNVEEKSASVDCNQTNQEKPSVVEEVKEDKEQSSSNVSQNELKTSATVTYMGKNVSTAEKGSMIAMFEVTNDDKYACVLCDETFAEETVAIAHFMVHDGEDPNCTRCGATYDSVDELLKHRTTCQPKVNENIKVETESKKSEHVCDICQQAFKTSHYLFRHMVIHTDVFKCEKCEKTFSRKDSMQKHVLKCCPQLAEQYQILYCEICFRVFSKESGKKRHMEKCKSVQCMVCSKIFSSQSDMAIHSCKTVDNDETAKYSCGRCSKVFQSLYYLKQHQSLHDNNHACNRCGKNFSSPDDLESHVGVCETLEDIRLYGSGTCLICKTTFTNLKLFRNHHLTHTHPFSCEKCGKRFMRIGSLNSHDCEVNQEWVCSVCCKTFKYQVNLERHRQENGCIKYQCSACNEQFHTKLLANSHNCIIGAAAEVEANIISKGNTKEMCSQCGKWFSNKSNLSKHMILHGEKKLCCPHCPKKFHLDVYLKEHITCVHFKIFKYQCNECGRLLKSKTGLIAHNRIFHAKNAETYPCTKCGKVFKQKGNLRAHMFSHSTDRKFRCDFCSRSFKYPDQLSRHKIEHKIMTKLKCTHCEKEFLRTYDLKKHLQVYHSGYIYVCGVCSARCGHRHTLVRHYKRKHPESLHLTRQEGYLDSLLKHYDELYENSNNAHPSRALMERKYKVGKTVENGVIVDQIIESAAVLPQDAAEALHSLSDGQVTAKQFQLLKEKGLFINPNTEIIQEHAGTLLEGQGQIIVPQDSCIFEGQTLDQGQLVENTEEIATTSSEGIVETIGMVQNPDGSISINEIHSIPQTLENCKAQIVILQIVNPNNPDQPREIILNQEQVLDGSPGDVLANGSEVFTEGSEIVTTSQIETVLIENEHTQVSSMIDLKCAEGVTESQEEVTEHEAQDSTESMIIEEEIKLEDGDPSIQAPMVYSQDVSCSE